MANAQGAEGLGRFLGACIGVVFVQQAAMEERAEVNEGLREADGAAAVEHEARGAAVAVVFVPRRALNRLRLAPLPGSAHVHE